MCINRWLYVCNQSTFHKIVTLILHLQRVMHCSKCFTNTNLINSHGDAVLNCATQSGLFFSTWTQILQPQRLLCGMVFSTCLRLAGLFLRPLPTSSFPRPPPQCFSALLPLAPQSLWPSSFLYPSHTFSCLWKFPHLKQVQRKPGRMGVTAPTGTGQWAYSLGTGSSGSRWSPRGPQREDGRMAELEGLGEGRRVKYI